MKASSSTRSSDRKAAGAPRKEQRRPAASVADLQARAREAAALLKALGNSDRLLLLCQLVNGERPVAELGAVTGIAQPSLSQQLGVLRHEGLVATRREGRFMHYRIASPAVHAVLATLYRLYCEDGDGSIH